MDLGTRIAAWRHHRGLTQEQLATHCGVVRGSVANWETGVADPPQKKLTLVIAALAEGDHVRFYGEVPTAQTALTESA